VGGLLVLVDALGKVEARTECLAHKIDYVSGHGGGEHEILAFDHLRVWQEFPDLVDLLGEAVVKQAVGLVHDECVQVRALDARVWVGENVEEATRRTNEKMAAFAQGFLKHGSLHGSADSCLDDKAGSSCDLLCFDSNLLRQLSGR
jgi:N-acyl-D-aspartate/D-glutamate deacylase